MTFVINLLISILVFAIKANVHRDGSKIQENFRVGLPDRFGIILSSRGQHLTEFVIFLHFFLPFLLDSGKSSCLSQFSVSMFEKRYQRRAFLKGCRTFQTPFNHPPVDLYLNFEKSSWKTQVQELNF